jgi:hypothetical protein
MRVTHGTVEDDGQGHWIVSVTHTMDDGAEVYGRHVFPHDTLEWRAAEYGIDPADTATLLDIVLAEPYLTDEDYAGGFHLHDAPSIQHARADHLARCAKVKLRTRMSTRTKDHPLGQIRDQSLMHTEALAIKQQLVTTARQGHAVHARIGLSDPHAERIAALRSQLPSPEPTRGSHGNR